MGHLVSSQICFRSISCSRINLQKGKNQQEAFEGIIRVVELLSIVFAYRVQKDGGDMKRWETQTQHVTSNSMIHHSLVCNFC